jgi:hypothetical protein
MKTASDTSGLIHYSSKSASNSKQGKVVKSVLDLTPLEDTSKASKAGTEAAEKVDISDEAKKAKDGEETAKEAKEAKEAKNTKKKTKKKLAKKKAKGSLKKTAKKVLAKLKKPPLPNPIPTPTPSLTPEISAMKEIGAAKGIQPDAAVFFLGGFEMLGLSEGGALKAMANYIPEGEHYSWSDKAKVLEEIEKRPEGVPIILVGHSYGGDTAVEIANDLNTPDFGFRKVDLLMTLDSVGSNNDIIPENVVKNINFIGDSGGFMNDGPNIARDSKATEVLNHLVSTGHTEIDDTKEVQINIFKNVKKAIEQARSESNFPKVNIKA